MIYRKGCNVPSTFLDNLPDDLILRTFLDVPRMPAMLRKSADVMQRYKRDFGEAHDASFSNRIYHAGMYILPFLADTVDTTQKRALEVGCGRGPYSAVLSQGFKEYVGIELAEESVRYADQFAKDFGLQNVSFIHDEAANLEKFLSNQKEKFDVIILHAVVEHLLPEERFSVLRACWDYLDDDGLLFIGEAPNAIYPMDVHSSYMLYFHQMPMEMWGHFIEPSRNAWWKNMIRRGIEEDTLTTNAFRAGVPVGFRELEKGLALNDIADIRRHVVSDNFNVFLMNRYVFNRLDFLKLAEIRQLKQYGMPQFKNRADVEYKDLPDMFSRPYLEVLLSKRQRPSIPSDWFSVSLHDNILDAAEMVDEGKLVYRQMPLIVELPGRLANKSQRIEVMLQVMDPADGGILVCESQSGARIFERHLQPSMLKVAATWRSRITYRLPAMSATDFPLKITSRGRPFRISYLFVRTNGDPDTPASDPLVTAAPGHDEVPA